MKGEQTNQIVSVDEDFLEALSTGNIKTQEEVENTEDNFELVTPKKLDVIDESFLDDLNTLKNSKNKKVEEVTDNSEIIEEVQEQDEEVVETETTELKSLYSAQLEYFKTKGILDKDFEIDEETLDESSFGDILDQIIDNIHNYTSSEVRAEYESKLGENILTFLENGGDYNSFAKLLKEQSDINSFDLETDSGQKEIVTKYYEELGWKPEKIKKYIDRLLLDDELEEEAISSKSELEKVSQRKQEELVNQQIEESKRQESIKLQRIEVFKNSIKDSYSSKDVEKMAEYAFGDGYKLKNGTIIPAIDYDLMMIKKDPKKLADVIHFINDPDSFINKIITSKNNQKVDNTFKTIVQKKVNVKPQAQKSDKKILGQFEFKI